MAAPKKDLLTPDSTDSMVNIQARHDRMRAEIEEQAKAEQEQEARRQQRAQLEAQETKRQEDQFVETVTQYADIKTRDQLLERIREMRAEKPAPYVPPPLTPAMQTQLELEQAAGRATVARNQATQDLYRAAREAAIKEDAAKRGEMSPVYRSNEGPPASDLLKKK